MQLKRTNTSVWHIYRNNTPLCNRNIRQNTTTLELTQHELNNIINQQQPIEGHHICRACTSLITPSKAYWHKNPSPQPTQIDPDYYANRVNQTFNLSPHDTNQLRSFLSTAPTRHEALQKLIPYVQSIKTNIPKPTKQATRVAIPGALDTAIRQASIQTKMPYVRILLESIKRYNTSQGG